ncbi:MAG TPA: hypothetical protein VHX42_01235 [Candidatus Babeliales bacterium]|nr:hypothetical protein [Candidatus Babeliales bacterium]
MQQKNNLVVYMFFIQCAFLFSYENSPDNGNSKHNAPQVEIYINTPRNLSPKNSWHFSTHVRELPDYSNLQRAGCSMIDYASPALQHHFHKEIVPLMYNATIKNHCCVIPGYSFPEGLRGCINQLSQFSNTDVGLSDLKNRLETYCNRIEKILFKGKNYEFCETISHSDQVALIKIYADFLKEFYAGNAPYILYNDPHKTPLMQHVMSTINWHYYDGSNIKTKPQKVAQRYAASLNGNLGAVYKALHEGDIERAYNIGQQVQIVGEKKEQTSVFKVYPALHQKVGDAYDIFKADRIASYSAKATKDKLEKAAQQRAAAVQAECAYHALQKSHLDTLQQRYDAATRAIFNSQSVKQMHKVTPSQATHIKSDHLTPDQKGILLDGNHLQHHLVEEAITVVDVVTSGDLIVNVNDAVLDLANRSLTLNKGGDVVMVSRTLDACWALVDFAKDAAQYTYSALATHVPLLAQGACDGVCESLHDAVHALWHPIEAAHNVVNSFVVAGYCLGKLAYADCVLDAATDLLETDPKQYEQMIQQYAIDPETLVAMYEYTQKSDVTKDIARVGTKVVVDMMLLHGVTKAVSAIAHECLPTFVSCMRKGGQSAEVAMTVEGVPVRCAEEVACMMEKMENANAKISTVIKEIAKEASELIKTFNIARYDASIGDLKKLEQAIEKLKDIRGALTKDGPLFKALEYGQKEEVFRDARKIAEIKGKLSTARGAMYEVEKALDLIEIGEEIVELGKKCGGKEFDIVTKTKFIECKNIDWACKTSEDMQYMKEQFGMQKRIASDEGMLFEVFSKQPIPEVLKNWFSKKGILFCEDAL